MANKYCRLVIGRSLGWNSAIRSLTEEEQCMTKPTFRRLANASCGICIILLSQGAAAQDAAQLLTCRQIVAVAERASCYDKIVDAANAELHAAAAATQGGTTATRQSPAKSSAAADTGPITVTVTRVSTSPAGKLMLFTADGAVWMQNDDQSIRNPPAEGTSIEIRDGALGSRFCQLNRHVAMRCRKVK
jgi:hypothetical protein